MEVIGILAFLAIFACGFVILVKHQKAVGWWMQTPNYDKEYKKKMLKRAIEDAQAELDKLEEKD